jgi:hypothetical protein
VCRTLRTRDLAPQRVHAETRADRSGSASAIRYEHEHCGARLHHGYMTYRMRVRSASAQRSEMNLERMLNNLYLNVEMNGVRRRRVDETFESKPKADKRENEKSVTYRLPLYGFKGKSEDRSK